MLVGVPSSFKTELVRLIDLPEIYGLDTLSENAFASGYVMPDGSDQKICAATRWKMLLSKISLLSFR